MKALIGFYLIAMAASITIILLTYIGTAREKRIFITYTAIVLAMAMIGCYLFCME